MVLKRSTQDIIMYSKHFHTFLDLGRMTPSTSSLLSVRSKVMLDILPLPRKICSLTVVTEDMGHRGYGHI
jgi:hypothetical protein